jgi:hypothetical protein
MSDDRGAVGSSAPFSEQEVERTRRLALSRLDELETSFHRVSERLVSVEARLGELAEDLRVRVTALQQQTRDAVAASLQMLAPQRDTTDITAGLEEIRAVVRADVQEIAASIRNTFVEAERRLLEEQASFLERAGASGEGLAARSEALWQAVESLRQQIAATGGTDEIRASVEALRQEVAASSGTEDLRLAIESLRGEVTAATSDDDPRQAIEALRGELAASKEGEELRAAIAALRQEIVDSPDGRDVVRDAVESLRQDLVAQIEQLRATVSEPGPAVDLTERLGAFQEELRALGDSVRNVVATVGEGAGTAERDTGGLEDAAAGLTSAVAGLREQIGEIARRMEAIDERSASAEERAVSIEERLSGAGGESGARFASALESALSTIELRLGEFREHLEGAVQSLAERPAPQPDEGAVAGLDERLGEFREKVEQSLNALNLQTVSQVEQVQGEIEGWMTRFGEVLEGSLDALRQPPESAAAVEGDDVRSEVGAMAQQVQEQMNRLEASLAELRDRVAFAGTGPETQVTGAPPEPPPTTQAQPAEEPVTATAVEPEVEETPEESPEESPEQIPEETPSDAEAAEGTREDEEEEAPSQPEPSEADLGHKKLPDIWSWGPKQG